MMDEPYTKNPSETSRDKNPLIVVRNELNRLLDHKSIKIEIDPLLSTSSVRCSPRFPLLGDGCRIKYFELTFDLEREEVREVLDRICEMAETETVKLEWAREPDGHVTTYTIRAKDSYEVDRGDRLKATLDTFKWMTLLGTGSTGLTGIYAGELGVSGVIATWSFGICAITSVLFVMFYLNKLEYPYTRKTYVKWAQNGWRLGSISVNAFLLGAVLLVLGGTIKWLYN